LSEAPQGEAPADESEPVGGEAEEAQDGGDPEEPEAEGEAEQGEEAVAEEAEQA
jgi:hypothetical protein